MTVSLRWNSVTPMILSKLASKQKEKISAFKHPGSLMNFQPLVLKCRQYFSNANVHWAWGGTVKSAFPTSSHVWLILLSSHFEEQGFFKDALLKVHLTLMWQRSSSRIQVSTAFGSIWIQSLRGTLWKTMLLDLLSSLPISSEARELVWCS